jgi:hypothetical protein
MLVNEISQNIQLVNEKETPVEALEIIDTLVEDRIRFHKIQMLRKWERNHRFDAVPHDQKIVELRAQRTSTKAFIAQAEREGYDVEITTNIEVRLVKKSPFNTVSLELSEN